MKREFLENIGTLHLEITGLCGVLEIRNLMLELICLLRANRPECDKVLLVHSDVVTVESPAKYLEAMDIIEKNIDVLSGIKLAVVAVEPNIVARNILFKSRLKGRVFIEVFDNIRWAYDWLLC